MGVFGRLKKKATNSNMEDTLTDTPSDTPRSLRPSPFSRVFTPRSFRSSRKPFDSGVPFSTTTSPVSLDDSTSPSRASATREDGPPSSAAGAGGANGNDDIVHHSVATLPALSPAMRVITARTMAASANHSSEWGAIEAGSTPTDSPRSGGFHSTQVRAHSTGHGTPDQPQKKRTMRAVTAFLTRRDVNSGNNSSPGAGTSSLSDNWLIDFNDLSLGKTIGHSSFGTVTEGLFNGTKVAVKTIHYDTTPNSPNSLSAFRAEAELNCRLRHPNIVLFMGICMQPSKVCLVTELMARGNVRDLLVKEVRGKHMRLEWRLRKQWALDTARGMAYLHSLEPPMIHRDLKTTNLLVDRGMNVKICDFGLSRIRSNKHMSAVGTVHFAAPEVLRNELYTEKADLFSYGTVMWELYTRRCVFDGIPQIEVFNAVMNGKMPGVDGDCEETYRKLMEACWSGNAQARPSFCQVIESLSSVVDETEVLATDI